MNVLLDVRDDFVQLLLDAFLLNLLAARLKITMDNEVEKIFEFRIFSRPDIGEIIAARRWINLANESFITEISGSFGFSPLITELLLSLLFTSADGWVGAMNCC